MRALYTLLCDFVLVSADGKPSVIGVFDAVRAPSTPFSYPRFALACRVELEAEPVGGKHIVQMTAQDPSGGVVFQAGGPITTKPTPTGISRSTFDTHLLLDGLMFQQFGTYTFSIAVDGVLLGTTQLNVLQIQGAPSVAG